MGASNFTDTTLSDISKLPLAVNEFVVSGTPSSSTVIPSTKPSSDTIEVWSPFKMKLELDE
ncbi:hypothetical protein MNB_SV-9-100 [hydrothermal vent metagenome]|uniref:Uncharacterized protein n=1 Tax=hydrothermal vent metagenome TaxID=652676 RepID=A0A1W1CGA3_9ZZZZ